MISKLKNVKPTILGLLISASLFSLCVEAAPTDESVTMRENIGALENTSNDIKDENGFYPGSRIYVSDQVNALLRFEPAANLRSAGALHPGDTVEFKSYSRDKRFAQIVWDGKTYWMRTGDLQSAPAAVNQVEEYKARLAQLNEENEKIKAEAEELKKTDQGQEIIKLNSQIQALKDENSSLRQALADQQSVVNRQNEQLQSSDHQDALSRELDMQMRWWLQGALIALGGAVAGIIFILLPRPRRQKNNRY